MPQLISKEQVGFELKLGAERKEANQLWLDYELIVQNGSRTRVYRNQEENLIYGRFSFNLSEKNELKTLCDQIKKFIAEPSHRELFFEPADPSFELQIHRTQHSQDEYKVYLWIDAGNTTRLMYSWDAEGIRFLVTKAELTQFANNLSALIEAS